MAVEVNNRSRQAGSLLTQKQRWIEKSQIQIVGSISSQHKSQGLFGIKQQKRNYSPSKLKRERRRRKISVLRASEKECSSCLFIWLCFRLWVLFLVNGAFESSSFSSFLFSWRPSWVLFLFHSAYSDVETSFVWCRRRSFWRRQWWFCLCGCWQISWEVYEFA